MKKASLFVVVAVIIAALLAFKSIDEGRELASQILPLSGNYTIGGTSPDYLTIGAAITDLSTEGIEGPVIFEIRDGSYVEQLSIGNIAGSSQINTITFRSESQDSSMVVISYDSPSNPNYVFQINNTDFLSFEHLTFESVDINYGRVITLVDTVENLTIRNCAFKAVDINDYHIYGNNIETFNLTIENCLFEDNGNGIFLDGTSNGGLYIYGLRVENNVFEDQYSRAIYTNLFKDPVIVGNNIFSINNTITYKVELNNNYDSIIVENNKISWPNASNGLIVDANRTASGQGNARVINNDIEINAGTGMVFYGNANNNGTLILTDNKINVYNGSYGIQYYYGGNVNNRAQFVNNFIHMGGTSTKYGFYGSSFNYTDIHYNSINISGSTGTNYAYWESCGRNTDMVNNVYSIQGNGYPIYVNNCYSNVFTRIDYNNYYSNNNIIHYRGTNYPNLEAYVSAWNVDSNTISYPAFFINDTSYQVAQIALNGMGIPVDVTVDIEGDMRDATDPDIGADEFDPPMVDAGIITATPPSAPFSAGNQTITAVLSNYGENALTSVDILWEVNEIAQTTNNWTGNLPSGDSVHVVLGVYDFQIDTGHVIKSWTSNPNGGSDAFAINDTSTIQNVYAGLSGDYTLGGTNPDISDFTKLRNLLNFGGVYGPVTIDVRDGTYTEQITLNQFPGTSLSNLVTVRSENGDSSAVILNFDSPSNSNHVMAFVGTDNITFEKMTFESLDLSYGRIFYLIDTVKNLSIKNCLFKTAHTYDYHIYGNNIENFNTVIQNCRFEGNGHGIFLDGTQNSNDFLPGLVIDNNVFINQNTRAIYTRFHLAPQVTNNTVVSNTFSGTTKIAIDDSYDGSVVSGNRIDWTNGSNGFQIEAYRTSGGIGDVIVSGNISNMAGGYGMTISGSANANGTMKCTDNMVNVTSGQYGIQYYYSGHVSNRPLFANNYIHVGGTNTNYGFYGSSFWYTDIYHNSINVTNASGTSYAYWESCGRYTDLVNNIFYVEGSGYSIYVANCYNEVFNRSDYNSVFSPGGTMFYRTTTYPSLEDYQAATNLDSNSIYLNPFFLNDTSYQVGQGGYHDAGLNVGLMTDIEGQSRDTLPDIGADEFDLAIVDAGVMEVVIPIAPFPQGDHLIKASLKNFGSDTLTQASIEWEVNGVTQTPVLWSGTLLSGDTTIVDLDTLSIIVGQGYRIDAKTNNPNSGDDLVPVNDTAFVNNVYAGLSGTYTLGGTSPDFPDFTSVQNQLNFGGVYGPVQIEVRDGTYSEQIRLNEFPGSSNANLVTIGSENQDSSLVILNYDSPSNAEWTLRLNGADHITFENMTFASLDPNYGRVIYLVDTVEHLTLQNCKFQSLTQYDYIIYGNDIENFYTTIKDCYFVGNGYAIHLDGTQNGNNYIDGCIIENNVFEDQYYRSIYLRFQKNAKVIGNVSTSSFTSSNTKFELDDCYDAVEVKNNVISWLSASNGMRVQSFRSSGGSGDFLVDSNEVEVVSGYGIQVDGNANANGSLIFTNNTINVLSGSYGLQYYFDGTADGKALVANNFIHLGGSSTKYGFYGSSFFWTNIYHNTININSSGGFAYAYYESCGRNTDMVNNIFNVEGNGQALYVTNCYAVPFDRLDHNNYRNLSSNLIYYKTAGYPDLESFQIATMLDSNSVTIEPLFINDTTDLHVTNVLLDKLGTPVPEVTIDIDGDTRDPVRPDLGADEFITAANDLSIIRLDAPQMLFPEGNEQVSISVLNNGLDTLNSFSLQWEVNGEPQSQFDWAGEALSGNSIDSLVIGSYAFEIDSAYTLKFWTENPNGQEDGYTLDDTLVISNLYAALGGTYTIGGTMPDFDSFGRAVTAMNNGGVIDSVKFNVRDGLYNERLVINEIVGASAAKSITFQSESDDPTSVTLSFASGNIDSTFVIVLDGADHFNFKNLTLNSEGSVRSRVVSIINGANNNSFEGNHIISDLVGTTSLEYSLILQSASQLNEGNTFINNTLTGGSYGIYYNSTSYSSGIKIIGNTLIDNYYQGIFTQNLEDQEISKNKIDGSGYTNYYGIYVNDPVEGLNINANSIVVHNGGRGIFVNDYNDLGTEKFAIVSNNFIRCNGTNSTNGIYANSSDRVKYAHNTIRINNSATNAQAFNFTNNTHQYLYNNICAIFGPGRTILTSSASDITDSDYNNMYTEGAVFAVYSGNVDDFDEWQTSTGFDANSYSLDPLFESDSSYVLLEIEFNNAGTPIDEVTTDIEGDSRDMNTPDIGADEYTPIIPDDIGIIEIVSPSMAHPFSGVNEEVKVVLRNNGSNNINTATINWVVDDINQFPYNWSGTLLPGERDTVMIGTTDLSFNTAHYIKAYSVQPNGVADNTPSNDTTTVNNLYAGLIGIYTVGGILPNFNTIGEAVEILNNGGVLGAVELRLRNGTYNEQIIITDVAGVSSTNTVTFTSETGDPSLTTIEYSGSSSMPFTIQLNDADHMIFKDLTLQSLSSNYGSVAYIQNEADSNLFMDNIIIANSGTYDDLVYSPGSEADQHNHFIGNTFIKGGRAIDFRGVNANELQEGTLIEANTFVDQYYEAIYLDDHDSPIIRSNEFYYAQRNVNSTSVYLYECDGNVLIEKNVIRRPSGTGIFVYYCTAFNSLEHGRIVNNVVSIGGTNNGDGIYVRNSSLFEVAHNSVHMYNTNTSSRAYYDRSNSNNTILNNVFANTGGGYAYYSTGGGITISDYNDIYATGANMGYWTNTNISDLLTWQSTSGEDANSLSANPLFFADDNLHVLQVALDSAALLMAEVTTDFEEDPRNATHPDIGADEFDFITDDLGVIAISQLTDGCELTNAEQIVLVIQNYGGLSQTGFEIALEVNGDPPIVENVGGLVVAPGDTAHYHMTTQVDLSSYQVHSLMANTNLAGDLNPDNDSYSNQVQNFQLPAVPANMLPPDGQVDVPKPINLSWLPSAGATLYDLYIWADTLPQPGTPYFNNLSQISAVINSSEFVFGIAYSWQVVAKNPYCASTGPIQTFTLRELPDLIASNISVPDMPFSSQEILVSWNVDNIGIGETLDETWYDQIYISQDNTLNKNFDTYLGAITNLSALASGESYAHEMTVTIPQGISGTWYLFVIPNGYNNIPEGDIDNNPLGVPINITLTPPPDLQVTSVIPPNNVFSGQEVNVNYTVTNEGDGETEESVWKDYIYISESLQFNLNTATFLKQVSHSGMLTSGASYVNNIPVEIPDEIFGDYFIHVFTDRLSQVYEFAFEDNNVGSSDTVNVILTPPPDLELTSYLLPDTLHPSQNVVTQFTVTNVGANPAEDGWNDRIYISAVDTFDNSALLLRSRYRGAPLYPGISYSQAESINIPINYDGDYYLYYRTDATNNVFEFNSETNNILRTDTIPVIAPDLGARSLVAPDTGWSGQSIIVSYKIVNLNRGKVFNKPNTDAVYISSSPTFDGSAMLVGEASYNLTSNPLDSLSKNMSVVLPEGIMGQYYLHVGADNEETIFEGSNEGNNMASIPITMMLSPSPDLQVSGFGLLPDTTLTIVTTVPVSFNVQNNGAAKATASWMDILYLSIDTVWNPNSPNNFILEERERFISLNEGGDYDVNVDVIFPMVEDLVPGRDSFTFYLYAITDLEDMVYEHEGLNDNNVLRSDPIYLICPTEVDLRIDELSEIPSDTLETSQEITVSWTVQNIGSSTSIWGYDFWYNGVYLSNDPIWDPDDLLIQDFTEEGPLDSLQYYSEEKTITIPEVPSGTYCLMMVADNKVYLDEESKTNNDMIFPVAGIATNVYIKQKPPANLVAKTFNPPVNGTAGQPIEIIYEVKNEGIGPVDEDWVDKIYLSTDFIIDNSDEIIYTSVNDPNLEVGMSYTDTVEAFLPIDEEGNFILLFKTDANNRIFEQGEEGDNSLFTFITVDRDDPSDLVVQDANVPASVFVNEKIDISYNVENIGQFPAGGVQRDILYLSQDSVFDVSDVQLGLQQMTSDLAPGANEDRMIEMVCTPGVPLGDYHVIVQADALNNIYEVSDENNVFISPGKISILVQELLLDVVTPDMLGHEKSVFYRIEIPDTLEDETLLVTLKADSISGNNELYLSFDQVPTRASHDFSHANPFSGNQEVVVPELDTGTYYLNTYGQHPAEATQNMTIHARIVNFFIRDIKENTGGNTGTMTARITGAKFTENMVVSLDDPVLGNQPAQKLFFINSTEIFASFNLAGAAVGVYDVVLDKGGGETAILEDGFTIIEGPVGSLDNNGLGDESGFNCFIKNLGTENLLSSNIIAPNAVRVGRVVPITIQYGNNGTMDIPCPQRFVISVRGAPLAHSPEELDENKQELLLVFEEPGGPPGILRPGATGSVTIYTFSSHPLRFYIQE